MKFSLFTFLLPICSLLSAVFFHPLPSYAATADLGISANNIRFSEETLYANETVRLYATVRNYGEVDVAAKVIFYQGALLIGSSQTVSVLADGGSDDVYVDYKVPKGSFNIRAVIQGQNPDDENSVNDEAITVIFISISDSDRDDVVDDEDNCIDDANADQADSDDDGKGDVCDADRDGDGVSNAKDAYPDDASKSADSAIPATPEDVVIPDVSPVEEPVVPSETIAISAKDDTSSSPIETIAASDVQTPSANPGIFGFGTLSISPYAQFSYRRIDWRTYEFIALPSEGEGEVTYSWDFGDGATSVQSSLVHAFPDAGQYVVTLAVVDEAGSTMSDAQTFDISFFHLHNPWIQATLAALFFILLGLVWFLVRIKESKEEKEHEYEV